MHAHHTQSQHTASSVGGLMEPAFLRGTMIDAEGSRHANTGASVPWLRWRAAARAVAVFFRLN